jgi:hypothetical protein
VVEPLNGINHRLIFSGYPNLLSRAQRLVKRQIGVISRFTQIVPKFFHEWIKEWIKIPARRGIGQMHWTQKPAEHLANDLVT